LAVPLKTDEEEKPVMSKPEPFEQFLSPSARALLKSIDRVEQGESLDYLFQRDPTLDRIQQMVSTYRGKLHKDLCDRLHFLIELGNISIITQHDLMQIAENIWYENISTLSKTELKFLSASFDLPGQPLKTQSTISRLSYSQTRRASKRLSETNILRVRCALNCENLGLTRLLLALEAPDFVIAGPFVTSTIFVEGAAPKTYQVLKVPSRNLDDLVIKALRTSSHRATIWRLSSGNMAFNGLMYHRKSGTWRPDWMHLQLILRNSIGNTLTMSSTSHGTIKAPHLSNSELKVVELLQENYELTAKEIATKTGISEATAFRIRRDIVDKNYTIPRSHLEIPGLQDRVIGLLDPKAAGEVYGAFDLLPLTYVAQCENIDNPSEKRALLMAALPSGSAPNLIRAAKSEMSKISENPFEIVSGGYIERLRVSSLYDRKEKGWRLDANLIDARSYATVRRESIGNRLPIDLA
jgi:DNA-binding CsgD family transcriptional regulator